MQRLMTTDVLLPDGNGGVGLVVSRWLFDVEGGILLAKLATTQSLSLLSS